jgi:hypothetical protein
MAGLPRVQVRSSPPAGNSLANLANLASDSSAVRGRRVSSATPPSMGASPLASPPGGAAGAGRGSSAPTHWGSLAEEAAGVVAGGKSPRIRELTQMLAAQGAK